MDNVDNNRSKGESGVKINDNIVQVFFLHFLTFLFLDNEQKAKDVVLYWYKHAASMFSVKFTPQLVEELKNELHPPSCVLL
jgi:hypothetical protein